MNSFCFDMPTEGSERRYLPPPFEHGKVFATLRCVPNQDESRAALAYVERVMGVSQYFVRSESDFDYVYANEANGFREVRRAWVVSVDTTDFRGRRIVDFVVRFLPSPWYEVEMQIEHDAEARKKGEKMKVSVVSTPTSDRVETMTDEEIVRSYEKAKRMAEINSSVPPSINGDLFTEPVRMPVDDLDSLRKGMEKKAGVDSERKEREAKLVESMLRNRERIRKSVPG